MHSLDKIYTTSSLEAKKEYPDQEKIFLLDNSESIEKIVPLSKKEYDSFSKEQYDKKIKNTLEYIRSTLKFSDNSFKENDGKDIYFLTIKSIEKELNNNNDNKIQRTSNDIVLHWIYIIQSFLDDSTLEKKTGEELKTILENNKKNWIKKYSKTNLTKISLLNDFLYLKKSFKNLSDLLYKEK